LVKIDYQESIEKLFDDELDLLIAANNLYNLTASITAKKHPVTLMRNALFNGDIGGITRYTRESINKFMNEKRFVAHIFPSIISYDKAVNFYLDKRYKPSREDIIKYLYLLSSGLSIRYNRNDICIFNIDNMEVDKWRWIKKLLTTDQILVLDRIGSTIDYRVLSNKTAYLPLTPFCFTLQLISYIGISILGTEDIDELDENVLTEYGITSDVYIYLITRRGPKTESYTIGRLDNLYLRYMRTTEDIYSILYFLQSLYIRDEDYVEQSTNLMDKFVYYLLNGYINGELLDKMILLKIKYELSKPPGEAIYGVRRAREFFGKL